MEEAKERNAARLKEALNEPEIDPGFVGELVVRMGAIENGRKAEQALAERKDLTAEEKTRYAAEGLVGRLMMTRKPPKSVTTEAMTGQLTDSEKFRKLTERPASRLAEELKNGSLIRELGAPAAGRKQEAPAAQVTAAKAGAKAAVKAEAKDGPGDPSVKAPGVPQL